LTTEQVAEIRERATAGERQSDMAREFGVNQGYVSQIVNFKRRKAA
jgi:DNA-binding transcriptional regulator YdaS (Cro superfamily)